MDNLEEDLVIRLKIKIVIIVKIIRIKKIVVFFDMYFFLYNYLLIIY
jgi:hypothetical protein